MIEMVRNLKARYGLKIAVVSNESREVNAYRIRKFKLDGFRGFLYFLLLRSRSQARRWRSFDLRWTSPRRHPARCSISKTHRCSSRSRKAWGFEAFFIRTTSPPEQNSLHSDCRADYETKLTRAS